MELKKVHGMVSKCYVIVSVMLVVLIAFSILNLVNLISDSSWQIMKQKTVLIENAISWVLCIGIYINLIQMFHSIKKHDTPFTSYVVKHIKMAAFLLFCWEPMTYLMNGFNRLFPYVNENGEGIVESHSFGGTFMILAIGLYVVAVIFQYGVALQKQSDETL